MDAVQFEALLDTMDRPGDELAAMRAHPDMTLRQAIALHRRVFGFTYGIDEFHELAHVMLGLTGFTRYQADYEGESFVLAIEDALDAAVEGGNVWDKDQLSKLVHSYNRGFAGDENMMRTLLHLLERPTGRDSHTIGASVGFENDQIISMASRHDIYVKPLMAIDTASPAWAIETGTADYIFDASPANPICILPSSVVPMKQASSEDIDQVFAGLGRVMPVLIETILCLRGDIAMSATKAADAPRAIKKSLMDKPVSLILDNMDPAPMHPGARKAMTVAPIAPPEL